MSIAAVGQLSAVAPPTTGTPIAGGGSDPMIAAAERVKQLQAMISLAETGTDQGDARSARIPGSASAESSNPSASVESYAPGASFSATLDAAQAASAGAGAGGPSPVGMVQADATLPQSPTTMATIPGQTPVGAYDPSSAADGTGAPSGGAGYAPMIEQAATRNGLDPGLLYGLIEQESGFDPSARSGVGAEGLTQLMPSTAASLGVSDPLNPAEAIEGGARYLAKQLQQFGGNAADALAAYNAGPGAVQQYGGVPPYAETQQYVSKVLGYAAAYNQGVAGEMRA